MTAGALSNDAARASLEQILSTSEFTQARLLQRCEDFIRRLFENHSFSGFHGPGLLLEGFVALAIFMLIIYLVRTVSPFWKVLVKDVKSDEVTESVYIQPSPADLLAEAEKKALQGDFRRALRDLYLCMLLEMDERRWITFKAAKTNCEYLREITDKASGVQAIFQSMVKLFERKWYGLEECAREDFQKGRELYASLLKDGAHG